MVTKRVKKYEKMMTHQRKNTNWEGGGARAPTYSPLDSSLVLAEYLSSIQHSSSLLF